MKRSRDAVGCGVAMLGWAAAGCHPSSGTLVFLATTVKHCRLELKEQLLLSDSSGGRLEGSP